ncbi:MAG TPA: sigma-70 domain-containing protein, partial [Thermoleophilaceae bacterium]|nr:sigma-70 domain-containing protein [Thermoleophilaceae bacterium]
ANKARTIRIPVHIGQRERKLVRAERELLAKLGREPTDTELAAAAELPLEQLEEVREAARTVTSLDKPVGEEGEAALGDLLESDNISPAEEVEVNLSQELLRRTVREFLPEPERRVIELRYGIGGQDPQPLRETGRRLGLSAERVRQLEAKALKRLAAHRELEALLETAA